MGNGWIKVANRVYQGIEILVNKVIRTNFAADFVVIPPGGDEFLISRHVDSIHIGEPHRRRG